MEEEFEDKYHEVEENHWWFVGRRDMIINILKKEDKKSAILDIGCSGGKLILDIQKSGFNDITGIDISRKAVEICKKKGINNCYLMDASFPKFKKKFDIIIASDVLEHIEKDAATLECWKNLLNDNGKIICFVPAFNFLWSNHDVLNKHFRRYTLAELVNLFHERGFLIEKASYWNFILFFPTFIIRRLFPNSKLSKNQLKGGSNFINKLIKNILYFENKILSSLKLPIGVSAFVITKKVDNFK